MTPRIQRMFQRQQKQKYRICIERFRIFLNTWAETTGEAEILRRAKAQYNELDQISIFIDPDELFVGHGASKPRGLEIDPNSGIWDRDEIDALVEEGYEFDPADAAELLELNRTLKPFGLNDGVAEAIRDREDFVNFMKVGVTLPPWVTLERGKQLGGGYALSGLGLGPGQCLVCFDYESALARGLNDMIAECDRELEKICFLERDSYDRCLFLKSVKLCLQGVIRYAQRFADLAQKQAGETSDPQRRQELLDIAEICRRVPALPPRSFREALQMYWFLFIIVACPNITAGMGRVDQILYPYYVSDKEAGRITDEEVVELFEMLRVKNMDMGSLGGKSRRACEDGEAKWHNMTIGGVHSDGSDATNPLSYLILDALLECPTPHHTITIRVADSTPGSLILKGLECQKRGLSMPAFISDDSYIGYFTSYGCPIELARNYCMTGCLDANIPGVSRSMTASMFIVPLFLTTFLNDGVDVRTGLRLGPPTGPLSRFTSFQEFEAAFQTAFAHYLSFAQERCNLQIASMQHYFPEPLRSAFMQDGIAAGVDFQSRTMPVENGGCLCPIGMVNLGNSLYAIEKLVFDESVVTLSELKQALDADWEGYEDLRQRCLKVDKYGNGVAAVDQKVAQYYQLLLDLNDQAATITGGTVRSTAVSITTHQPGGVLTFATPDGRKAHSILADGAASPMMGQDKNGPLAMLKSAMTLPQTKYQGVLLNMKFHPSALQSTSDLEKLATLLRTYLKNGGKHIQFNVTSQEQLRAAQEHPDEHRDIMVRVAGYSAYFVQLNRPMQEEIIARTSNDRLA